MCGELLCELLRHDSFTDQLSIAIAVLIPPQAIAIAIVKCTLKYNVNVNVVNHTRNIYVLSTYVNTLGFGT